MANFNESPAWKRGLICCAEKHLWKYGAVVMAVYSKAAGLTHGGQSHFFTSPKKIAEFLGCSERQSRQAFQRLDETGWLTIITPETKHLGQLRAQTHSEKIRQWIHHDKWIEANPGHCYERETLPWDSEQHDTLGRQLYRFSDGKLKWYANELKALRKPGHSDSEIIDVWKRMVEARRAEMLAQRAAGQWGSMAWRKLKWDFIKNLAGFQPVTG
jgi:hypothetical protein